MRIRALQNIADIETEAHNVHVVRFSGVRANWEQHFLITSDRHFDHRASDRELQRRHLEMAVSRNAFVIDVGDWFDLMQGRNDPRSSYDDLLPQYKTDRYVDAVIDDATKFFADYAPHVLLVARGNHETAFTKHRGVDVTSWFVGRLRENKASVAQAGGYGGWIRFQFEIQKTRHTSINLKYFHGGGAGATMSFGTLDIRRQAAYLPDADVVVNGHTHDGYVIPVARERLSNAGKVHHDTTWFLRTMTYKNEYGDGSGGWAVEKKHPPKPLGAIWGRFCFDEQSGVKVEFTQMVK